MVLSEMPDPEPKLPYILTASMASKQACLSLRDALRKLDIEPRYDPSSLSGKATNQFVVNYDPDDTLEEVGRMAEALAEEIGEVSKMPTFHKLPPPMRQPDSVAFNWYDGVAVRAIDDYLVHADKRIGRLDILISP